MASDARRALSLGLRGRQLCCLFFRDDELLNWHSTRKGAASPETACVSLATWISAYQPHCVILENPDRPGRKKEKKKAILRALGASVEDHQILKLEATRVRDYATLYDEAAALAERFPEFAPLLPLKPPIWETEHRNTVYFEALSLAVRTLGI